MPAYTNSTNVNRHLPSGLPSTVTDYVANDIADASAVVDGSVGALYGLNYNSSGQRFPDITDSPGTPALIEQAARFLAVAYQYSRAGENVGEDEITQEERFTKRADKILEDVRSGKVHIVINGTNIRSSGLDYVEDDVYEDLDEAIFNGDDIDALQY